MELTYRTANKDDLSEIIAMLADDQLGKTREDPRTPINPAYLQMFDTIDADANNELIIVTQKQTIVGLLQLTYIPYLTYTGSWRALVEGVRVHKNYRSQGIGRQMFIWAIDRAKQRNCAMIQLTSNKQRQDALRFYESLGFTASHEGFKQLL